MSANVIFSIYMVSNFIDSIMHHQALHDQYLALWRGPGFAQLCLARKLLRRAGLDFLILILGSPKFTFFTLNESQDCFHYLIILTLRKHPILVQTYLCTNDVIFVQISIKKEHDISE